MTTSDKVIKGATNEWVLLIYRGVTALCAVIITAFVVGTRNDVKELATDLNLFRLLQVERIAKVEGEVGALRGSVEVHRKRLEGLDIETRSIWGRLYDLKSQPQKGNP